jgi:DMSO/TMAO reductase YedYZ heme-binding membrane subunit
MTTQTTTRIVRMVLALVCFAPLIVWLASVQHPLSYVRFGGMPPGQQLYLVAKLAGLLAFCLFWTQCVLALARHAPMLPGFPASDLRLHRRLGFTTAGLILVHVGCFLVATSMRTGHPAWDLLLPVFDQGFYKFSIGLGVVAFWLVCVTVFAGWRTSRGGRRWKAIHLLWPAVFGLAFWHAFTIGTESRFGGMRYLVLALVASLTVAAMARWFRSRRRPAAGHWNNGVTPAS